LLHANHNTDSAVASYPADANGISAARAGAATLVLGARWYHRDPASGSSTATSVDAPLLLAAFDDDDHMLPLPGHFLAWHGTWTDLDRDGWITDPAFTGAAFVDVMSGRTCGERSLRVDDPDGGIVGNVSFRCSAADEWDGATTSADAVEVVGYVTPYVPTQTHAGLTLFEEQTRNPDLAFRLDPTAPEGGRYLAPRSNFDLVPFDNGLLETTVTEVLSKPTLATTGPRTKIFGDLSLIDVDLYTSIDPNVETLYQDRVLREIASRDCDADHPENNAPLVPRLFEADGNGCVAATPLADVVEATYPTVGPVAARVLPPAENDGPEGVGRHSTRPHVWFDVDLAYAAYVPAAAVTQDGDLGQVAPMADGRAGAPLVAGVYGHLGVWHDLDADGWIGAPAVPHGCGDAYACGTVQDPNLYRDTEEWNPTCRPVGTTGIVNATLSSSTGAWGPTGAYLVSDGEPRSSGFASEPFDDVVLDLLDADVDRLVLAGPIPVHLVCTGPPGFYRSYEHVVFPIAKADFDVRLETEVFRVSFLAADGPVTEQTFDEDTVPASMST
ncbi:MAG TPA: hypothetical protein VI997_01420, partial [Candidatus Thermoplasmatota archaeon]|nr:hypothetical protein [Candidatus Thermoplasmatota archaeon]